MLNPKSENITTLKTVRIGNTVKTIGTYVFTYCSSLESFTVVENNENYKSIDGVLFDTTSLIHYPQQKKDVRYTIPDGYTEIKGYAFHNNQYLDYIKFNDNITSIYKTCI